MREVKIYDSSKKSEWDSFVKTSRNGTFLFLRDYMDYHADRFKDYSLMFYDEKNHLIALLPAHIKEDLFCSHQGLTYGGFIFDEKMTGTMMLEIFDETIHLLKENSIKKWIYSPIPYIYNRYPSEEDLYALFKKEAVLKERKISSVIPLQSAYHFNQLRKRKVKKAINENFLLIQDDNYVDFWKILSSNLKEKYAAQPVHTLSEIQSLNSKFKGNILLYRICRKGENETLAGCVIYKTEKVAHVQYIASTPEGRQYGAVDFLFYKLINEVYKDLTFFDLGTSVEDGGKYLNEGLLFQKEGFGGRAIMYDTYELDINKK